MIIWNQNYLKRTFRAYHFFWIWHFFVGSDMLRPVAFILLVEMIKLTCIRVAKISISHLSETKFKRSSFWTDLPEKPTITNTEIDYFTNHQILDQRAPVKTIKQRARPNSFINDNIRSLTRTRDYWQWLARQTNDPAIWSGYRNFKREVKREIRFAQRELVEEQIKQNPNDVGNIWKTIRSWIPKKPANIKSFTKDEQTVANEFNRFLSSVGKSTMEKTQLARKFNYMPAQDPCTPKNYIVADQFSINTVECS